ncbi:hypothetical protein V5O48_002156 [Marasmius crinis-equi]|uniref:Uncharacterized protein n=1 Tax=Marasmius crinis-equi TaxID=585013 RepID=A0ABR3FX65_9AGAR
MPTKRSVSAQSAAAGPARKRVQLDDESGSDTKTPPLAASPSNDCAPATPIKKPCVPTSRLRASLADGEHDIFFANGAPDKTSIAAAVSSSPSTGPTSPVIELSSSDESRPSKLSFSPAKGQSKKAAPSSKKQATAVRNPKKASQDTTSTRVVSIKPTPISKNAHRPGKGLDSVNIRSVDNTSDVEPLAKALTSREGKKTDSKLRADSGISSSDETSDIEGLADFPSKRTSAKSGRKAIHAASDNSDPEAEDPDKTPTNKTRHSAHTRRPPAVATARQRASSDVEDRREIPFNVKGGKGIKKPRIRPIPGSDDERGGSDIEVPASQLLSSPLQLAQKGPVRTKSSEDLFDDEAREDDGAASGDDGVASGDEPDDGATDHAGDDSFINDAVDENNEPVESDVEGQEVVDLNIVDTKKTSKEVVKAAAIQTSRILQPDIQHPDLVDYYASLPAHALPSSVAHLHPYGWAPGQRNNDVEGLDVQAVIDGCDVEELTRFKRSITFSSYFNAFQPGRCDIRQFSFERDCIRVRLDNGKGAVGPVAVWITTGIATRSYLDSPYCPRSVPGQEDRDTRVYKIVVQPSEQERYLLESIFGHIMRTPHFVGPVWESGLSFCGQKPVEEVADDTSRTPRKSAFSKKKAVKRTEASSSAASSSATAGGGETFMKSMPVHRSFAERVPVYDGRRLPSLNSRGFAWKDADWERLPHLPLYDTEVEPDSLVTVGYTVSGWRPAIPVLPKLKNMTFVNLATVAYCTPITYFLILASLMYL